MQSFLSTYILRHQRENLKKCSLRGLEKRKDCQFFTYPTSVLPDLSQYFLLAIEAPPLHSSDFNKGIFLLDATWRYADKMLNFVESQAKIEGVFQKDLERLIHGDKMIALTQRKDLLLLKLYTLPILCWGAIHQVY